MLDLYFDQIAGLRELCDARHAYNNALDAARDMGDEAFAGVPIAVTLPQQEPALLRRYPAALVFFYAYGLTRVHKKHPNRIARVEAGQTAMARLIAGDNPAHVATTLGQNLDSLARRFWT